MKIVLSVLFLFIVIAAFPQDSSLTSAVKDTADLLRSIEPADGDAIIYTRATFKTTRLINGHTVENVGKGVLDLKISHRFGKVNGGGYEFFGLDNATMRLGFDYGFTDFLMVGIGRSTFQKTYDGFIKIKLLRQSSGRVNMPVTVSYVPAMSFFTLKFDKTRKNLSSSRYSYSHQLLIGRKFSEGTSVQLMPTFIHQNLVTLASDHNNMYALGIGARQKISKRTSVNAEYYYQVPGTQLNGMSNSLSAGFDIETGGHVFQLHLTNSQGMTEPSFISNTRGKWDKGDIFFGFNVSRVFNVGKHK